MTKFVLTVFCATCFFSACSSPETKPEPIPALSKKRLAGRVQSVSKTSKFVLIRRYGPWRVSEGEWVESRGDGRTANLLPTGEKLGEHIAADIRSGLVEVGDDVYIRKILQKETSKEAELSGNVEKLPSPEN